MDALRLETPDLLAGRYEGIRADVAGRDSVRQRLFCQRGLAAWLAEWSGSPARPVQARRPLAALDPPIPASSAESLTLAIASLVHAVLVGAPPC